MKKTFTAEEKKAWYAQQKQAVQQALIDGVKACYTSENWTKYLDTISKFHNYSLFNCMLIAMQKPEATYVAGMNDWNKKFKRHVVKGEKSIKILAPIKCKFKKEEELDDGTTKEVEIEYLRFKLVPVFDVSQTDGAELPTICKVLKGEVEDYNELLQKLTTLAGIKVEFENIAGGANGYYNRVENRIAIQENMPEAMTIKTLVHEIAHSILHKDAFMNISREVKEMQAESVAYMVCKGLGIDTDQYSFEYVASWAQADLKTLNQQMDIVRKTADHIIESVLN